MLAVCFPTTGPAATSPPPGRFERLLPAGEGPERLAGGQVLGPYGDELPVLDLLDQHLVLVLVGVAVVVGELDGAIQRFPAAGIERLAGFLPVAVSLRRRLRQDPHRRVSRGGVIAGRLVVALLVDLGELLGAGPRHGGRPLRAGEDSVRDGALLGELRVGEAGAGAEEGLGREADLARLP